MEWTIGKRRRWKELHEGWVRHGGTENFIPECRDAKVSLHFLEQLVASFRDNREVQEFQRSYGAPALRRATAHRSDEEAAFAFISWRRSGGDPLTVCANLESKARPKGLTLTQFRGVLAELERLAQLELMAPTNGLQACVETFERKLGRRPVNKTFPDFKKALESTREQLIGVQVAGRKRKPAVNLVDMHPPSTPRRASPLRRFVPIGLALTAVVIGAASVVGGVWQKGNADRSSSSPASSPSPQRGNGQKSKERGKSQRPQTPKRPDLLPFTPIADEGTNFIAKMGGRQKLVADILHEQSFLVRAYDEGRARHMVGEMVDALRQEKHLQSATERAMRELRAGPDTPTVNRFLRQLSSEASRDSLRKAKNQWRLGSREESRRLRYRSLRQRDTYQWTMTLPVHHHRHASEPTRAGARQSVARDQRYVPAAVQSSGVASFMRHAGHQSNAPSLPAEARHDALSGSAPSSVHPPGSAPASAASDGLAASNVSTGRGSGHLDATRLSGRGGSLGF